AGFFRQSCATQLIEMQRFAEKGCESRIHFASSEGVIPTAAELSALDVSIFVGGIREPADIVALLENLQYAYLRAGRIAFRA
ncbi:hypothetical protein, partial [Rhizobium leguminosarum]|uniref:hypothetical protein n=1 Tax=Rhizobium leguminosarum TaxID=384 RepID=UPI003F9A8283